MKIATRMTPDDEAAPVTLMFVPDPASGRGAFRSTLSREDAARYPLGQYVALSACPAPDGG